VGDEDWGWALLSAPSAQARACLCMMLDSGNVLGLSCMTALPSCWWSGCDHTTAFPFPPKKEKMTLGNGPGINYSL